jgi:hypothetical protein
MNQKMELEHLAIAERAVLEGERHIAREERMIANLDRAGRDTTLARAKLATLRRTQAEHVAHRDLLLEVLQRHGCTILTTSQPEESFRASICNRHP